jgi:hypothetical protein
MHFEVSGEGSIVTMNAMKAAAWHRPEILPEIHLFMRTPVGAE